MPLAEAVLADRKATALLIFPTKALTQDQFASLYRLGLKELVPAVYDGDTEQEARAWVRRHANAVLTNPDMLHIGILPGHARWARFLGNLRLVVVDELHTYRGIFGSHVALVLRRLRRLAAHYGANPTFVFSSATIGNPGELASRLTGLPVTTVDDDASPAGAKQIVIWNPPLEDPESGDRRSALSEATDLLVDLVGRGRHTIAFTRSRKGVELVYRWARDRLGPDLAGRIAPYRAGYLPEERRKVEQRLFSGELLGVTATSALELGIDVGSLDAAIITTFPGTIASFRQQAGRAGRTREESLAVLVAGEDALDQYYAHHPGELFRRPSEKAVVNPANPQVLAAHAGCAAFEKPLAPEDRDFLGEEIEELAPDLVASGDLRPRGGLLYWDRREAPAPGIDIRTAGGPPLTIVDERGEVVGTVDEGRACSQTHPGAVYLHQGDGLPGGEPRPGRAPGAGAPRGGALVHPAPRGDLGDGAPGGRRKAGWAASATATARSRWRATCSASSAAAWPTAPSWATSRSTCRRAASPPRRSGSPWTTPCSTTPASGPRPCPAPCTPPSTPRSPCSPCSPSATAGTWAASPPPSTPTPAGRCGSSTTATPAGRASPPSAGPPGSGTCGPPSRRCAPAPAGAGAPPACSRPSAATSTNRSTRRAPSPCWRRASALAG